ncbi:choice-of-anchor I family protein [Pantanalinema rosaneae CENA516]|uniref:choice-of-anchor I family protein n=1 Tax=Pantanalinema rosaneae TaxID=1620701 RepID=UPI003D6FA182
MAIGDNDTSTGFLTKIGGYTSSNGAEIPAFDPTSQRLFVVAGSTIEILDLSNPSSPTKLGDLNPGFAIPTGTAAIPNSVAVKNGIVAVAYAIQNTTTNAQLPGRVSFFNAVDGSWLHSVEVGYLPDMLTFTPDGTKVLTANEGEPNSYGQPDSFDPEGSVSIIDLTNGVTNATVQTAGFTAFNDQIDSLRAAGVRIFGPGATVAQDLEPEYIAFSSDGTKAYVTLQENNAFAIVDIATATVTEIKPLGFKNYNQPTVTGLETYEFTNLPVLGTTAAGQEIPLGGFSGLTFEGYTATGDLKFITHTDRGPNGEPTGINRPFLLSDFAPEIIRFELSRTTGQITITERIQLKDAQGNLLSGLPNTAISNNANQPYNDEVPVDLQGNVLPLDPLGADLEGIVVAPDGTFWMVDEYRPAIYHFNSNGVLIDRFVPIGTAAAAGQPAGTFGTEVLPEVLAQRRQNRGFEAVALQDGKVYAFVQSPLRNPDTLSNATLNGLQNIRIVEFDPATNTTRQFLYIMDNPPAVSSTDTRADKIGDAVAIGNGEFLVLERDDDAIDSDPLEQIQKKIYRFSLADATDISSLPNLINGKTLEQMTLAELQAAGVTPIQKTLHVDLATAGYNRVEKVEGLTIIDRNTLAVINDNDFTVAGITIDPTTGTFTPDPNAEKPILGLITLQPNGIDPSDRDNGINIRSVPVFGMYQPDAIASFTANGQTYFITANEGDARDYLGFSEEIRVGANGYRMDAATFPNATTLKQTANLGRLNVTSATGDTDGDGDFDRIVAFGARSFSIWDSNGNLVFDSGDQLEQVTAAQTPTLFNSDGTAASFDTRSDNKGPEPEGVVVGVINNRTYAFIGLERTGDVIVYEVTNPHQPVFVQYLNLPEDVAPEGLTFVSAADSPTGKPLLITASEVSNTVAVFEVTPPIRISDIQGSGHTSPLANQTVTQVPGIVTALESNGFYLQDPHPDNNEATSEGIFVFTSSRPTVRVGDAVEVTGRVSEFIPGGAATGNLSITQITATGNTARITVLSSGNPLPAAIVLGVDRIPPNQIIDNDNFTLFDPIQDGIDFYESLEGMRVTVKDALAVSPTNNFGEIFTLANNGIGATGLSDRGTINISPSDFNPERIQIQLDPDTLPGFPIPQVNVGDRLGDVTGVIDYNFGNFEVKVTQPFTPVAGGLQPEVTLLTGTSSQLTIASYNTLNLDPRLEDITKVSGTTPAQRQSNVDDDTARFAAIAQQIVNHLKSPDILGLQEIQDNDGAELSEIVAANETLQTLIEAIVAAGGPRYAFVDHPFIGNGTNGGQPGGNIRNTFLYNPDRVSLVTNSVRTITDPTQQQADSLAFDQYAPDRNPFLDSRLPLVATFSFQGQEVTVVNNHFASKGGSSPLFGANQPSVSDQPNQGQENPAINGGVEQRRAQAEAVKGFVDSLLATDPYAHVVVLGDLNEFEFISPLTILEQSLVNLTNTLPDTERYSYIFDGNSQSLDHILVSQGLVNKGVEFDIVHVNSEFVNAASDHDPLLARLNLSNLAPINTVPTAQTTTQDSILIFSAATGNAIAISDVDANNGIEQVQLSVSHGFLSLGSTNGLTVNGNHSASITIQGTLTNLNNALNGLKYTPDAPAVLHGSVTFTILTDDLGNTGIGGAQTDTDSFTIAVNPAHLILGTSGNNTLRGTAGADTIYGRAGNDKIYGNGGNDILLGEDGNDELYGGSGDDYIDGGNGNDKIYAYGGNNTIYGRAGNDTISVGHGINFIDAGSGNDTIYLGGGQDTIVLARGNGIDTIYNYAAGSTRFNLTAGLTYEGLTIAQSGNNALISAGTERLATLVGVQANSLTRHHFI